MTWIVADPGVFASQPEELMASVLGTFLALERDLGLGTIPIPEALSAITLAPNERDTKAVLLWCGLIGTMCEDVRFRQVVVDLQKSFVQQLVAFVCSAHQLVGFAGAKALTELTKHIWNMTCTVQLGLIEEAVKTGTPQSRKLFRVLADLFREDTELRSGIPRIGSTELISALNSPNPQDQFAALDLIECEGERLKEFMLPVARSLWGRETFPFVRHKAMLLVMDATTAIVAMQAEVVEQLFLRLVDQTDLLQPDAPSKAADLRRSWFVLFVRLWGWLESNKPTFLQVVPSSPLLVHTIFQFRQLKRRPGST